MISFVPPETQADVERRRREVVARALEEMERTVEGWAARKSTEQVIPQMGEVKER